MIRHDRSTTHGSVGYSVLLRLAWGMGRYVDLDLAGLIMIIRAMLV